MPWPYFITLLITTAYVLFVSIGNIIYLRRSTRPPVLRSGPFVSVIVPARDEARNIRRCVWSLLQQDYSDYEVIVVDDDSSDSTVQIVSELAAADLRLRLVEAGPLPPGWLGKPWALSRGAEVALGDVLLLADADTAHTPHSISWAVTNLTAQRADFLSGYVQQEYGTFGEQLVVPTMYAAMLVVPFFALAQTRSPRLSFVIGQYVVLRRNALRAIGGFRAIRDSITDDMTMAALLKERGCRGVFLDARAAASCRLYHGFRESFNGIKRSIYGAIGGTPIAAVAVVVVALSIVVAPAVWLLAAYVGMAAGGGALAVPPPVAYSALAFGVTWAIVLWDRHAPVATVLLYPAVFLNLLLVLAASVASTGFGKGAEWKGRLVRLPSHPGRGRESATGSARVAPKQAMPK